MKIQLYLFSVFAIIVMAWSVSPLWAQDKTEPASVWQDWDVTLGAGASYKAVSPGVDEYKTSAIPYLDITYQDRYFLNVQKGLGAYVYKGDASEDSLFGEIGVGAALGYDQGRDASDFEETPNLQGLGDLDGSLEGKAFLEAEVGVFDVSVDFAQALTSDGHEGWYSNVGLSFDKMVGKKLYFSVGQSLRFSSEDFQQAYYGVDAAQSRATGLQQYSPGSGLESTSFEVVGRYFLTENWSLLAKAEHRYLLGDAADSPFVEEKSQIQGLFALAYQF
ncbi:MipA/OmpV family protein [Terasakiella pusilla]|uniref:MipA/OmpV family protein n=1 Tax=Terasakiella pusilla TaxID=64973 RepID=UPI003AA818D9